MPGGGGGGARVWRHRKVILWGRESGLRWGYRLSDKRRHVHCSVRDHAANEAGRNKKEDREDRENRGIAVL